MSFVIFAIDFENNPLRMNVFKGYLAYLTMRKRLTGNVLQMVGSYKGTLEHCFICNVEDFEECFRGTVYIKGQESILHVASGNKMEARLEYLADGRIEALGSMHQVSKAEAMAEMSWMYRADMDAYWVARKGNPDILPPSTGWPAMVAPTVWAMAAE